MALGTVYNIGSKAQASGPSTTVVTVGTDQNSDATTVPATGDSVFVLIGIGTTGTVNSVTDSKANTYTLATNGNFAPANNEQIKIYECLNPGTHLAAADTVTVTWSASTSASTNVRVIGCSGVASTSADDGSGSASGTGTAVSAATGALAQASELAVMVVQGGNATGGVASYGGGFTQMGHNLHTGIASYMGVATQNTSATTALTGTATNTTSGQWGALVLTFKAATSGGLSITTASPLPGGQIGVAYTDQFAASGGVSPYTWDITVGAFQTGLSLSSGVNTGGSADLTYAGLNAGPFGAPTIAQLNAVNAAFGPVGCTKFFFSSGGSGIYTGLLGGDTNGGGTAGWSAAGGSAGYTPSAITAAIPGIFILINWGAMMSATAIKNFILSIPTTVAEVGFCFQSEPEHAYASGAGTQYVADWTDQANKINACRGLTPVKLTLMTANYLSPYTTGDSSVMSGQWIPPPSVVDVYGLDFYDRAGQNVGPDMGSSVGWVNYTGLVKKFGKPIGIPEFGLSGYATSAAQNTRLQADWKYIQGAFGAGGTLSPYPLYMWNYWNVNGTSTSNSGTGNINQLTSAAAQQQWAAIEATAGTTTSGGGTGGVLSGTPTVASTVTPTVRVTDSAAATATKVLSLTISAAGALAENDTDPLAGGTINIAYSTPLNASGGTAPYTYSVNSGALPAGLSISGGLITGTPSAAGTYTFVIKVTDNVAATALSPTLHITVSSSLTVTTTSLAAAQVAQSYTATLASAGGTAPYTWGLASGVLPDGLTLDRNAGIIAGTPTTAGSNQLILQLTDGSGATAVSGQMSLVVNPAAGGLPTLGRRKFGGGSSDWVGTFVGDAWQRAPNATVMFFTDLLGGTQYTGLLTTTGISVDTITADGFGEVGEFFGPSGVWRMAMDANGGTGPRRWILANDMGDELTSLHNALTSGIFGPPASGGGGTGPLIPSGDVTGSVDTVAIQGALTAAISGSTVQLANGIFYTSAPLTIPPGVELAGSHGSKHVTAGTTITLTSGFAGSAAVILAGGTEHRVTRINIDGTAAAAGTVIGVSADTSTTGVQYVQLTDLLITGAGISNGVSAQATGGNLPNGWRCSGVVVLNVGSTGILLVNAADGHWTNCQSIGAGNFGWSVNGTTNSLFTACRADFAVNDGWAITGSWSTGAGSGGCQFIGCSTDRNGHSGVNITATGSVPVFFDGIMCRRDGFSSTSGGFAGFRLNGATVPVVVDGITVWPGPADGGGGNVTPQYGISVVGSSAYLQVASGYVQGVSASVNNDGTNTYAAISSEVIRASGPNTAAVFDGQPTSKANVSEVDVTNTGTETTLVTLTLPTGSLRAGSSYRINVMGTVATLATSGTLTFKTYLGANAAAQQPQMTSNAGFATSGFFLEMFVTVRTTGASGTYIAHGRGEIEFTTRMNLTTTSVATAVVDTTAASPVIKLTATWATPSASNVLAVSLATIEPVVRVLT
jgi:Putative Ig domain